MRGYLKAFRTGDVTGLFAAADYFRERGDAGLGYAMEVLAMELEEPCARARRVRWVLDHCPAVPEPGSRPTTRREHVADFVSNIGLPVSIEGSANVFTILAANDGAHTDTEDRLLQLFYTAFPNASFFVCFDNYPYSELGQRAYGALVTGRGA
jgi:hypothetical protein